MPEKNNSAHKGITQALDLKDIDPSPFQVRKYFNEDKQKELAESIKREGLIEPIVVRRKGKGYELIAGERRFRAVRDFTDMKTIPAQIVKATDPEARRMSAAENLQRQDLSAIEMIEAIVEIVDGELTEDKQYAAMGKKPADRVKTLLGKLDSVRRTQERGSSVSRQSKSLSHKFMGQVEKIFKNLPKPLEWRSFYNNDLPILIDFCEEVQEASMQNRLNRSQTRALEKLRAASKQEFYTLTAHGQESSDPVKGPDSTHFSKIDLRDLSSREIEEIADKAAKKDSQAALNRARVSPSLGFEAKIFMMSRFGIPANRIATRLKVNRLTALKYSENPRLIRSIRSALKKGNSTNQVAKEQGCPEPLVWSIALEGKSDQERFKSLGWGLRTWDHWYFNDVDYRFGDDWPGRIPAQLVGHTLFYFTQEGDLVFDPMAGGGVVADTCLAFNRKCWSFDLADRPETRPEIEPYQWNPESMVWPVPPKGRRAGKGKEKPALILFDPPYFKKQENQYTKDSISSLSRKEYLGFFKEFFPLVKENSKGRARIAFLNADWRDFQGVSALNEDPGRSIFLLDYMDIMRRSGWKITHIIDCPLSTQRFLPNMVSRMQKNRTLGVVRRSLMIGRKK